MKEPSTLVSMDLSYCYEGNGEERRRKEEEKKEGTRGKKVEVLKKGLQR